MSHKEGVYKVKDSHSRPYFKYFSWWIKNGIGHYQWLDNNMNTDTSVYTCSVADILSYTEKYCGKRVKPKVNQSYIV